MERHYLLLLAVLTVASTAAQIAGEDFLNIDCGKAEGYKYNDSVTGLFYTSDHQYVSTGEIHTVSSLESAYSDQAGDLRSFPNGTRNCYTLPMKPGSKYLLRARFMYGNYDNMNKLPRFALHAGVNYWHLVTLRDMSINLFVDLVFVSNARESMDLCLVNTGDGTPFISALELRPLPIQVYPQANATQALMLFGRYNFGAQMLLRYPDDQYDRIWNIYTPEGWTTHSTSSQVQPDGTCKISSRVLSTAVSTKSTLNISYPMLTLAETFHIFLHFAELETLRSNDSRLFDIFVNNEPLVVSFTPPYLIESKAYTHTPVLKDKPLNFALVQTGDSTLPPIINAAEVYMARDMTGAETSQQDVDAIMAIKAAYKVQKNWEGDPCSPSSFMWEGLNCSSDGSNRLKIISLSLISSGLTGEISDAIGNLTQLQTLDLSRNCLTGTIPNFLADLTKLTFLDLTGNKIEGSVPQALLDRSTAGSLTLKVGNNSDSCNVTTASENQKKSKTKILPIIAASISSILLLALVGAVFILWRKKKHAGLPKNKNNANNPTAQKHYKVSPIGMESLGTENKQFSYADVEMITKNFRKEIGRGGFGPVYYGVLENNVEVAVKLLSNSSSQGPKEFQNEALLLTRIHHRNLVSFVGYCNENINNLALIYEYMEEGSLQDHLQGRNTKSNMSLNWITRLRIAIEAAQGLEYLHNGCKPATVHRDVTTNNILLSKNLEAKIADFGLSKNFEKESYSHVSTLVMGTPGYLDPEYYLTNKLTEKSDVYSFGIVLMELITGLPAIITDKGNINIVQWVRKNLEQGDIRKIVDKRLQGDYSMDSIWKLVEIALACTLQISAQRITMSEVLSLLKDCVQLETKKEQSITTSQILTNSFHKSALVEFLGIDVTSILVPSAR